MKRMNIKRFLTLGVLILASSLLLQQLVDAQVFKNVTDQAGVSYIQMDPDFVPPPPEDSRDLYHYQSGGVAAGDYDNDGWVDLFVTRVGASDILFRNLGPDQEGRVRFEDVSEKVGLTDVFDSNGAAWADFDRNGYLDLYIVTMYTDRNYLYMNDGGTFKVAPNSRGAGQIDPLTDKQGSSVAVGDYDKDGWVDVHATEWFIDTTDERSELHNVLLTNLGPVAAAFFRNDTLRAGAEINRGDVQLVPHGFAFASSFADMDNDGWPDLAVTGDFVSSEMFWNNGDTTFTEITESAGLGLANNAMGSTIADYDGDGDLDWYVTSRYDNRLYQNQGNRQFVDVARELGIDDTGWGWAASWIDYDNDGDWDLAVTNGYNDYSGNKPDIDPTYFYINEGGSFRSAAAELGITDNDYGKGLITFDYDNDGDLDLFITNSQATPDFYENTTVNNNNWLQFSLVGRQSNPHGLQAKVYVKRTETSTAQFQELIGGSNFLGQNEMILHYGLGPGVSDVHSVEIRWPSGTNQLLQSVKTNQELILFEPSDQAQWLEVNFDQNDREDPNISGNEADPDDDGLSNFFEYAFASDPQAVTTTKPIVSIERDVAETEFVFVRNPNRLDIEFLYETSNDLIKWEIISAEEVVTKPIGIKPNGGELVAVTLSHAIDSAPFIRVRVREKTL